MADEKEIKVLSTSAGNWCATRGECLDDYEAKPVTGSVSYDIYVSYYETNEEIKKIKAAHRLAEEEMRGLAKKLGAEVITDKKISIAVHSQVSHLILIIDGVALIKKTNKL
jgi:hypothetical protein